MAIGDCRFVRLRIDDCDCRLTIEIADWQLRRGLAIADWRFASRLHSQVFEYDRIFAIRSAFPHDGHGSRRAGSDIEGRIRLAGLSGGRCQTEILHEPLVEKGGGGRSTTYG